MPSTSRIVVIFTGGTIASTLDDAWGGVVPSMSGGEILSRIPHVQDIAQITVHEFGTYPGPHITPDIMFKLVGVVQEYINRDDIDGVVITHGTDTLEETAYFLDCCIDSEKPIVVIGAMRNSSELDWDGPRNVRDGVTVAGSKSVRGLGVLVCLGGTITAASETTKTDTEDVNTFSSYDFGPLGRITNSHLTMYRRPLHRSPFRTTYIPHVVPLLKSYAGMDAMLVDTCIEAGAEGIVIEAFGVGNVTPPVYHALTRAIERGIPVVMVSRCPVGRIQHLYAYEGAGVHLHAAGVIFADYLNGQKARIKLICALGAGLSIAQIRESFEWQDDQVAN